VSLEALLGTVLAPPFGMDHWLAGFFLHLGIGGTAGLVYAAAFEMAVQRSGAAVGAGLGLCHGLLAGLMMSGIPAMNPLAFGTGSAPGPFLQHLEYGPFLFLALHCLYGTVVGVAYGPPLEKPHAYPGKTA